MKTSIKLLGFALALITFSNIDVNAQSRQDRREDVQDKREDRKDEAEDRRDRAEDVRDAKEDIRDARHNGGRKDKL